MISNTELMILLGVVALMGMGVAITVLTMARQPEMKEQLGKRIALIAIVEAVCLMLVIGTLLVVDI